jgi:hypothetical protein
MVEISRQFSFFSGRRDGGLKVHCTSVVVIAWHGPQTTVRYHWPWQWFSHSPQAVFSQFHNVSDNMPLLNLRLALGLNMFAPP